MHSTLKTLTKSWRLDWKILRPTVSCTDLFISWLLSNKLHLRDTEKKQTHKYKTLPKAQRTRGLSSAQQSNFFRSYFKFLHKSRSIIFRISTKYQLQNLNQTSSFRQNLNLKLLTKPSFRISTKIKLHNHSPASAAK